MKIVRYKAINYKGIKELEIIPDGNLIILSGKNGMGKTSTLHGIKNLLCGKSKEIKKPIKDGEDEAVLEMDLCDNNSLTYKVRKVIKENKEELQITTDDGMKCTSPQSFLKNLTGGKNFDPNVFLNKTDVKQREDLIAFAGVDLDEYDDALKELYEKRHQVGIEGKALAHYTNEEIEDALKYKDKQEIDIIELTKKYENESNNHREYSQCQESIKQNDIDIEKLKLDIKILEEQKEIWLKIEKPESNLESIKCDLNDADDENKKIRNAHQVLNSNVKVVEKKKEWNQLDSDYKDVQESKKTALIEMELPMKGLSVTDTSILFNNIPIKQLSTSEGLTLAIKIYIETCIKDKIELTLITVENGNDWDSDNIKAVAEVINQYDNITAVIERIANSKDESMGIYIENGEVVN